MNAHDELERLLGEDLRRQADGMSGASLDLHQVKGRARSIRRNRQVVAGVGLAAALAIIVPTALSGTASSTREIQPAPSPDVPVEVARTILTVGGLARGDAPAIEYFTPDGVVLPDDGLRPLPESYQALVRSEVHGGWLGLGPGGDEVRNLSEDLAQLDQVPSYGFESTPTRDLVAWTVPEPGSQTLLVRSTSDPDAVTSWTFGERPVVEPVGILGPDSVVYETRDARGETTVGLGNPDGTTTPLPYLGGISADPVHGLVAVQTASNGSSGCFAVVEASTSEPAWETCDYALGSFSPDGLHLMATAAESDGAGPTSLFVLDSRTGEVVTEFASQGRRMVTLVGPAWESADAVVAAASEGNRQTLVRMTIDGTLEEVADAVEGSAFDDWYYYLGADRRGL